MGSGREKARGEEVGAHRHRSIIDRHVSNSWPIVGRGEAGEFVGSAGTAFACSGRLWEKSSHTQRWYSNSLGRGMIKVLAPSVLADSKHTHACWIRMHEQDVYMQAFRKPDGCMNMAVQTPTLSLSSGEKKGRVWRGTNFLTACPPSPYLRITCEWSQ